MNGLREAQAMSPRDDLVALIRSGALRLHYQPIAELATGKVCGHEALVRTPDGCRFRTPDELFAAARHAGMSVDVEVECLRLALASWRSFGLSTPVFVNLSADALVCLLERNRTEAIFGPGSGQTMATGRVVVELTEHEHVRDVDALVAAAMQLRRHKVRIALDDFGDGRSSLRLWSELKPELVKIDKYFTRDLAQHQERVQTLRALTQIAHTLGSELVAEGIESLEALHIVRDLRVAMGQGWAIGRPEATPCQDLPKDVARVLGTLDVAVFPERRVTNVSRISARSILRAMPSVEAKSTNEQLFECFSKNEELAAVAIVHEGRPVGLIGRRAFIDKYAKPFFREIHGRNPCTTLANMSPRVIDASADVEELARILTSEDQRYLSDGVIVTENGAYRGVALGEDVVRMVTEARIEAARHANPLTLLPGNIPITQHLQRLLDSGREFAACYVDLNHFKPFNDVFGYWRGDEMILLAAQTAVASADPRRDFVGHVGGDDFLILYQSSDWESRVRTLIESFNVQALNLYDSSTREAGVLVAEDRQGIEREHPLTTMSVGGVCVPPNCPLDAEQVANAAAWSKRHAKASKLGFYVMAALADPCPFDPSRPGALPGRGQ